MSRRARWFALLMLIWLVDLAAGVFLAKHWTNDRWLLVEIPGMTAVVVSLVYWAFAMCALLGPGRRKS